MTSNIIIPLCIYHNINQQTNTYLAYLSYPSAVNKNGQEVFECNRLRNEGYDNRWRYYGTFYAISPMIRPIPQSLKMIKCEHMGKYPYNTSTIKYVYDLFNIDKNAISFITWTKAVQGTVPLYLYTTPDGCFPSFDKNLSWGQNIMSPIFVMIDPLKNTFITDSTSSSFHEFERDKNGIIQFKFSPIQARCLPDNKGMSLAKCFLLTDENILKNNDFLPVNLLDIIKDNKKGKLQQLFYKVEDKLPHQLLLLFIISFVICIIILYKKKMKL